MKAAGCKVISSATTSAEAEWLAERGCDAIIAQGYEAGGHSSIFLNEDVFAQAGTMALVPQVVDVVDVLVSRRAELRTAAVLRPPSRSGLPARKSERRTCSPLNRWSAKSIGTL